MEQQSSTSNYYWYHLNSISSKLVSSKFVGCVYHGIFLMDKYIMFLMDKYENGIFLMDKYVMVYF